jgi:hypothetical protein
LQRIANVHKSEFTRNLRNRMLICGFFVGAIIWEDGCFEVTLRYSWINSLFQPVSIVPPRLKM